MCVCVSLCLRHDIHTMTRTHDRGTWRPAVGLGFKGSMDMMTLARCEPVSGCCCQELPTSGGTFNNHTDFSELLVSRRELEASQSTPASAFTAISPNFSTLMCVCLCAFLFSRLSCLFYSPETNIHTAVMDTSTHARTHTHGRLQWSGRCEQWLPVRGAQQEKRSEANVVAALGNLITTLVFFGRLVSREERFSRAGQGRRKMYFSSKNSSATFGLGIRGVFVNSSVCKVKTHWIFYNPEMAIF